MEPGPSPGASDRARVLIVEDHPLTAYGTSAALEQAGVLVVGVARSGQTALAMATEQAPHVVVLDLQLPDMSGVAVARALLQQHPGIHIVVLTGQIDVTYAKALSRLGVRSYLTKDADLQDLLAAIRGTTSGNPLPGAASDAKRNPRSALSAREREILSLVVHGQTNAEIAQQLVISTKAVEYHLTAMFDRFGVRNRTELTRYALMHKLT